MAGEDLTKDVAGLKATMDIMMRILQDIQKELRENHMPLAQIQEKFKVSGEKMVDFESTLKAFQAETLKRFEEVARATEVKELELELKRQIMAIGLENEKREVAAQLKEEKIEDHKRESPYKLMAALVLVLTAIGFIATAVNWAFHHIK